MTPRGAAAWLSELDQRTAAFDRGNACSRSKAPLAVRHSIAIALLPSTNYAASVNRASQSQRDSPANQQEDSFSFSDHGL